MKDSRLFFIANKISDIYSKDELLHPFVSGNIETAGASRGEFKRKELRADKHTRASQNPDLCHPQTAIQWVLLKFKKKKAIF